MPDGKTHDKITIYVAPIVVVLTYVIGKDMITTAIVLGGYCFSSLMFNGDLDCHSRPFNRWWLLKMFWIPYQMMFKHRSIFTHGLIIGTVIRLIYLGIIPVTILLLGHDITPVVEWVKSNTDIVFPILIGLELGSAGHTIADYL